MVNVNEGQVGGDHYKKQRIIHWDYVAANDLDYFTGNATKYVSRWRDKGGIQDLEKALHYIDKYIEVETARKGVGQVVSWFVRLFLYFVKVDHYHRPEITWEAFCSANQLDFQQTRMVHLLYDYHVGGDLIYLHGAREVLVEYIDAAKAAIIEGEEAGPGYIDQDGAYNE